MNRVPLFIQLQFKKNGDNINSNDDVFDYDNEDYDDGGVKIKTCLFISKKKKEKYFN